MQVYPVCQGALCTKQVRKLQIAQRMMGLLAPPSHICPFLQPIRKEFVRVSLKETDKLVTDRPFGFWQKLACNCVNDRYVSVSFD